MTLRLAHSDISSRADRILCKSRRTRNVEGAVGGYAMTISKGSYNAMNCMTVYANIMTEVFKRPAVEFSSALWEAMISSQADPGATRIILSAMCVDRFEANRILRQVPFMNWTTFLYSVCEIRQAMGKTKASRARFWALVERLVQRPALQSAVLDVVRHIVHEGACSQKCSCELVCQHIMNWFPDLFDLPCRNGVIDLE